MHEATTIPTLTSDTSENLTAAARRAESWFGEPFLQPDEDPLQALAPGHRTTAGARRRARRDRCRADDAVGALESALRAHARARARAHRGPRATAAGTELRRHQVDALAGHARRAHRGDAAPARRRTATGTARAANGAVAEVDADEDADDDFDAGFIEDDELPSAEFTGDDPGAVRRFRFRHPTASGKTIAAAGFVEAARHLGVLILTHRRLLVTQFKRDLTTEGYGDRFTDAIVAGRDRYRPTAPSRSRRTPGSRATAPSSTATPTTSSSATRRTPRSERRRALRSARSRSRSSSG